jgi:hypothetical protein
MRETGVRTFTQLFTLHLWLEDMGNGRCEIRGQVKHILTGETIHFREWSPFLAFLQQKLEVNDISKRS